MRFHIPPFNPDLFTLPTGQLMKVDLPCINATTSAAAGGAYEYMRTPQTEQRPPDPPASVAGPFQQQPSSHSRGNRNKTNVGHGTEGFLEGAGVVM